ncbi:hypothetical protein [Thalassospira aquimaris]|uniref:Uncharacterized protein n=1 Tax=Thalassospira aquimaris TaxID=3037796 RepID=A0ABT6GHQ5_9PROT|nr:hypothetical protein [Thalassospira sp. FZY0004]MDG4721603.1 hypothetical protein [Thalassospira sp. FZY0004]
MDKATETAEMIIEQANAFQRAVNRIIDPELIERLKRAAGKKMNVSEVAAQKASFVWGQLPHDHPMSKEDVAEYLGGFKSIEQINEERMADWHRQLDDLKATNITVTHDGETLALPPTKIDNLDRRVAETIRELSDDGFSPYGSGPEPIGPRNNDCGAYFDR